MPQTQSSTPPASAVPVFAADAGEAGQDFDYALGCECADPGLQIETWHRESHAAASAAEPHH